MNASQKTAVNNLVEAGLAGGPPPPLLTAREVARVLAVSVTAVYELCAAGQLAHWRIGASWVRIRNDRADLEAYLRQTKIAAADVSQVAVSAKCGSRTKALQLLGATLLRAAGWKGADDSQ